MFTFEPKMSFVLLCLKLVYFKLQCFIFFLQVRNPAFQLFHFFTMSPHLINDILRPFIWWGSVWWKPPVRLLIERHWICLCVTVSLEHRLAWLIWFSCPDYCTSWRHSRNFWMIWFRVFMSFFLQTLTSLPPLLNDFTELNIGCFNPLLLQLQLSFFFCLFFRVEVWWPFLFIFCCLFSLFCLPFILFRLGYSKYKS